MGSRWLPGTAALVATRECDRGEHGKCPVTWPGGECGCTCHLSPLTDGRGG